MFDMNDFKAWLLSNGKTLANRSTMEIAEMAVRCGFDSRMVGQWAIRHKFEGNE